MARLGELLVERGLVTLEEVAQAREAKRPDERIGDALVRLGFASHHDVTHALADQTGMPVADLKGFTPEGPVLDLVPTRFVFRSHVMPLSRDNGTLQVATADPFCMSALDELRLMTGLTIEAHLAPRDELEETIHRLYGVGADALDKAIDEGVMARQIVQTDEGDLDSDDDAALIQFVNRLLLDAVGARASDIHVEPAEHDLKVRYRIDGVLQPATLPREMKRFQAAIISRIKIMSNLDIAEKRLPQDGRIRLKVQEREMDVRVSVIPTLYGEGLALRILDAGASQSGDGLRLSEIGLSEQQVKTFQKFITAPHGIVLVTGPTGSGKSTTLYAGLQEIDRDALKVITVEDPVEYRLPGISQIQVREKIGLTFARGLRHILRHDPDVVMIGEIRDHETAEIAVQAALTGHLVLSTLHTNDASGAVPRLIDMGVEPYLVAATLEGLLAQRLLRRVCPRCAFDHTVTEDERMQLMTLGLSDVESYKRGAGCETCNGQGYFGRTAIFEMIPVDDQVRQLTTQRVSAVQLRAYVRSQGHGSLRDDGLRLVRLGRSTPDEVLRVTRAD